MFPFHKTIVLQIVVFTIQCVICQKNNVCPTYIDYFKMENNPNCWYDPDVEADLPEILSNHNYPMETYNITTEDGYILTIFRMPKKNPKGIIVLEPPLTGTGATYMSSGNGSLAFVFYEAGYEVWLPNSRGTYYSQKHVDLNDQDVRFWDFSFHELGVYDYPAEIDLVSKVTKRNDLILVGYSMAGTASAIYASTHREHAKRNIGLIVAMGPTIYVSHDRIPPISVDTSTEIMKTYFGHATVFSSYEAARRKVRKYCTDHKLKIICVLTANKNAGGTPNNYDPAIVPRLHTNLPTRMSLKIMQHYGQISVSDRFQQFDYGPVKNMMLYNSVIPPLYPLENISVPFYIMYGDQDDSCTMKAVERIYSELSDKGKMYGKHLIKRYNHFDFLFSKTTKHEVADHILEFIKDKF